MAAEPIQTPTPLQTLFLWAMIARGGEAPQKGLKPKLDKAERAALVRLGMVTETRGPRRSILIELTDRGWAWAAANTSARLPDRGTAALPILTDLLVVLGQYLATHDVSLAEFVRPAIKPAAMPDPAREDLSERIRAAYLSATGQATNRRARLADIRRALADVPRETQDLALRALVQAGGAGLLPLDDPTEVTGADRDAALMVGDQPRHILWLDR